MENYSIFGSNIYNEYLLKLQNNSSNINIDIHNTDHNFTLNYESSNQHSYKYNKLGLQNITRVDNNNYIHYSLINDSNVVIQGKYGRLENNINNIYFPTLDYNDDNISIQITQKISEPFFNIYDGLFNSLYYKYSSTMSYNNLGIEHKGILDNFKFLDINLVIKEINTIKGVLIHTIFNDKYNISKYKFYGFTTNHVFPHIVNFYQVIGNNAYFIHTKTFNNINDFIAEDIIEKDTLISNECIIHIESVLIDSNLFNSDVAQIKAVDNRETTISLTVKNLENKNNPSDYKLKASFFGIKLLAPNKKIINEYDIDMYDYNIQNVDTLSLKQLILNDVIYTKIVSEDNIISSINDVIAQNDSIKTSIVQGYLDENSININNLKHVFNPGFIRDIGSNERCNVSEKYIPYVYLNSDTTSITFQYDCNINIKYLLNLAQLDNTDKILKHSNGIIYKENKLDYLTITNNLTILSNIGVSGNITINSNILKWDENIDKFTHSDGKIIPDNVFDMVNYNPIKNNTIINFNSNYDAFTLGFSNNDKQYYIRHPYNFVNRGFANENAVYQTYINSMHSISGVATTCNLKMQFLHLIEKVNLYISSRFGNIYNNSIPSFVTLQNNPQAIETSRTTKLSYMSNQQSISYLDYYEYELPEKVLLKSISYYDIHFKDYSNLLNKYYNKITEDISYTAGLQNIYTFPNKNYLDNYDIIGFNVNWELIQHVTINKEITLNQYKEQKIKSDKRYSRYRIAFNNSSGSNIEYPFILKDLKFNVEYSKKNNNLIYTGDYANFNIVNNLSINNNIRWNEYFNTSNNICTKLIINEDVLSINDFYAVTNITNKTIPFAVCHINETIDNTKLLENHMLKFGLVNNNFILPDSDYSSYSLTKHTPSVYHSLHIMNDSVYYTLSVINKLNTVKNSYNHNEFLILVENQKTTEYLKGIVSVNISKECLCNMINSPDNNSSNITGLVINPSIRLCTFNNVNLKSYMDIGINNNLTLINSYRIDLPTNSCNITTDETYYLKPTADHSTKTITTEWTPLGNEIFIKPNIYIGKPENTRIIGSSYCNINRNDSIETIEHLIHIRKLFIGYPELASNIDTINRNVLTVGGSVYASHDVSTDSDISYKYNLEKIQDVRYKVEQLNGYTFDRNDTNEKRRFSGLIAQDVEKVLPEVIIRKHDGKLRVLYNNLAGLFVECFKDLYKEIDELKKEVRSHKVEQ